MVFAVQHTVFVVQVHNIVVEEVFYIQDGQVHHILVVIAVLAVAEVVLVAHLMASMYSTSPNTLFNTIHF